MSDYSVLKSKLSDPALAGLTDMEILSALNTKNIPQKQPIITKEILAYLAKYGKWRAIADSTDPIARDAVDLLTIFNTFDVRNPDYLGRLTQVLDGLISIGLLTSVDNDKANILSLGDTMKSWSELNWQGDVSLRDIAESRNYV